MKKIVCNVMANPNIRYIIVGGPESEGHLIGEALKALLLNGVDDKGKPFLKTVTHFRKTRQRQETFNRYS